MPQFSVLGMLGLGLRIRSPLGLWVPRCENSEKLPLENCWSETRPEQGLAMQGWGGASGPGRG